MKALTDARFRVLDVEGLTYDERNVLADDVREIVTDERRAFDDAERILRTRIGGQSALRGYVAVLMAGRRRASR